MDWPLQGAEAPPLALYLHLPWCVRKCPYCDFNSHGLRGAIPEGAYVEALLRDLALERDLAGGRRIDSVFLGGGTPSLFSGEAIAGLLEGVRALLLLSATAEITLEANPGTVETGRFRDYRAAGVNRLSIGVQSFDDGLLCAIGRIHRADDARRAFAVARGAGFDNVNLDLMFALPGQTEALALADLRTALELGPEHLSWYQLTLEPGTAFHRRPPALPLEDDVAAIQESGQALLAEAGYCQYEVSAYARDQRRCRHNMNYWTFGDYLGIGAGAHGKLTDSTGIRRRVRVRLPRRYMEVAGGPAAVAGQQRLSPQDAAAEFMINALRLVEGIPHDLFRERTGLDSALLEPALEEARRRGLLESPSEPIRPTALGRRYLNDLLCLFLEPPQFPDPGGAVAAV